MTLPISVTRWFFKIKSRPKCSPTPFLSQLIHNFFRGKKNYLKTLGYFFICIKLPKVNNSSIGENSPNLVTLLPIKADQTNKKNISPVHTTNNTTCRISLPNFRIGLGRNFRLGWIGHFWGPRWLFCKIGLFTEQDKNQAYRSSRKFRPLGPSPAQSFAKVLMLQTLTYYYNEPLVKISYIWR
jgi:hypothetical protein